MINVGTTAVLKRDVLGNESGIKGVCYETYQLGNRNGYSFIFPNGNYDGFGEDEVDIFFDMNSLEQTQLNYNFQNVIRLSEDFRNGYFDKVF